MQTRSLIFTLSTLLLCGVSPQVVMAQQFLIDVNGANGANGASGSFAPGDDGEPGDNGSPGGTDAGGNSGTISTNNQAAVLGTANGGSGGNGGDDPGSPLVPQGGKGGDGAQGGSIVIFNAGTLTTNGDFAFGLQASAVGGSGGNGGKGGNFPFGLASGAGDGGNGSSGGTATANNNAASISTTGVAAIGIAAIADGGAGGNGGVAEGVFSGSGGTGGTGGNGGTATANNNGGTVNTIGAFAYGILARAAGGVAGNGESGTGIIVGSGGNGGPATVGGTAIGNNSGTVTTGGDYASGMVVQSVGGGGGSGGAGFGLFGGGGSGAAGNDGRDATGTNTGTITTHGVKAIGMLVESVGGGGGDGGGAAGIISLGGDGAGGGIGGTARGNLAGTIETGADGSGDGATGILIQSVGGGGGNGGFAGSALSPVNISIGGNGGGGGTGGKVIVRDVNGSGPVVRTNGFSATGILAQSVGGGGGNGGGAVGAGTVSIVVGGKGAGGGDGETVDYYVAGANVTTRGNNSSGIVVQSVGGGGGSGGFAMSASTLVSIAVGGNGGKGGNGSQVDAISAATINTFGDSSNGFLVQSIGGGGGDGGAAGAVTASIASVAVAVGGSGSGGGDGGVVNATHVGDITVRGTYSKAIIAQSIGGGGGNGGESLSAAIAVSPWPTGALAVAVGGNADKGGDGKAVTLTASGNLKSLSSGDGTGGILAQSIGGGGGTGGSSFALAGAASPSVAVSANVAVGGTGGGGGKAGTVTVNTLSGSIEVTGVNAAGILAQSIGGGGGKGGKSWGASGGFGPSATINAGVNIGGSGGDGNVSEKVTVNNAMSITMKGDGTDGKGQKNNSAAIKAQSIGGGGGSGGSANGTTADIAASSSVKVNAKLVIGGFGGTGNDGGEVVVNNSGRLETFGQFSAGIHAQSIGGGGGDGGASNADSFRVKGKSGTSVSADVSIGGFGAGGGIGKSVTVDNGGSIYTHGIGSNGILAMSVGGGGGSGGASSIRDQVLDLEKKDDSEAPSEADAANTKEDSSSETRIAIGVGVAGFGAAAGNAGSVYVTNRSGVEIFTRHDDSNGIAAHSIGGSGGVGATASAASTGTISIGGALGGFGGAAGDGAAVIVSSEANARITTWGRNSNGILAQSIGGGGGNGGAGMSTGDGAAKVDLKLSIGGFGAKGGHGGTVDVTNAGTIETLGRYSNGIMAQSIGGSGGNGGAAGSTASESKIAIKFDLGGFGGTGGFGGDVTVKNFVGGAIFTHGSNSYGILAQSVGGGGGTGGAGSTKSEAKKVSVDLTIGGLGGNANYGGVVDVTNNDRIETTGAFSHGIFAESIGGGGGASGAAANSSNTKIAIGATGALPAGDGSYGGSVKVQNSGVILTARNHSSGIFAHSVGGSGGFGGAVTSSQEITGVGVNLTLGGIGGGGGKGGNVTVANYSTGTLFTKGDFSHGILAQSVGGGGGVGGSATNEVRAAAEGGSEEGSTENPDKEKEEAISIIAAIGGRGGAANTGGTVDVTNNGLIVTRGAESIGIFAESIGGGGGASGAAGNKTLPGGKISIGAVASLDAGQGADGGEVTVRNSGIVDTTRDGSIGIFAHSVGGGGGSGGAVTSELTGNDFAIGFALGGFGKAGGAGNTVRVFNVLGADITTRGDNAHGIFAQSVGGGGGKGGSATTKLEAQKASEEENGTQSGDGIAINATLGGFAGEGNQGGEVSVENDGSIITRGRMSHGIFAETIGGGGGASGAADNTTTAKMTIGATGSFLAGKGANGGTVHVINSGSITTLKDGSIGIFAHSVGGGGGFGGAASTASSGAEKDISFAMGGLGANGGAGGLVTVNNKATGTIITVGNNAHGILAQSIGGGGGAGGASSTNSSAAELSITATLGGFGGSGTKGGIVIVENSGSILTFGTFAHGVFAESVGGGGGASGATTQAATAKTTIGASFGALAGGGADGGIVSVNNYNRIATVGAGAHGILAHSVGGGGGFGGSATTSQKPGDLGVTLTMGGVAGDGGAGGSVFVTNDAAGLITTEGMGAVGISAQSVGGGGGVGGSASIGIDDAEGKATAVTATLGGLSGAGNDGGTVSVENKGRIQTLGDLSHGIFAESVGGGGGASGSASSTSTANMTIGLSVATPGGGAAKGGNVTVLNSGIIETFGNGALGIFAQSVGGGGGYGGVSSADAAGDSSVTTSIGGFGGGGGDGGDVYVDVSGAIVTHGERAHGVVAQSVGGSGGFAGDAKGKTNIALAIGGFGGSGGDGGDVTVIRTGSIVTTGKDAVAIIAQSVGGGGGIGGAGFGRFKTDGDGTQPDSIGFNSPDGSKGTGGKVTITQTGDIFTSGDRAHGIVAQAVGGSGGLGGTSSLALGQSGAGSNGGIGNAADVAATAKSQVKVDGNSAYALFGQSATGIGTSGKVDLLAESNLIAQGMDSIAAYGESSSALGKGNIAITLNGQLTAGGGGSGVAAMLVGGVDNKIVNHSLTFANSQVLLGNEELATVLSTFSPLAISGTYGNDRVENSKASGTLGRIIGNVELADGVNSMQNFADASFVGLNKIGLGGGTFTNDGMMTNEGIGVFGAVAVSGGYLQSGSGDFVTDIDLNAEKTDRLDLTGAGNFAGEAPLNFLTIDNLFKEYTVAKGSSMVNNGITARTQHPTVGFDFKFRVDSGTDLVLYADKPTFDSLVKDPASGVSDDNTFEMAAYLDRIEAAPIAVNPMARLINMLRFLPDVKTLGDTVVRLTPHYAVHTFDMLNRSTDLALNQSRRCKQDGILDSDGNCVWLAGSPNVRYDRDAGSGLLEHDKMADISLGGMAAVNNQVSLGASIALTEFESRIFYNGSLLSNTDGTSLQGYVLADYANDGFSLKTAIGGGKGKFRGQRDTEVAQAGFIPGETVVGEYLPEELLEGIGKVVTYQQDTTQLAISTKAAYKFSSEHVYVQPGVQLDGRWITVDGREEGSLAAFSFQNSSNTMFAITPQLEVGFDTAVGDAGTFRLFADAGLRKSFGKWAMDGGFAAAEGLGVAPLRLTQPHDSPLLMFGGGAEFATPDGAQLSLRYDGTKSKYTKQHAVTVNFKFEF